LISEKDQKGFKEQDTTPSKLNIRTVG